MFNNEGEIQLIFFNDMASLYYDQLYVNEVIIVEHGTLKHAGKFNKANNNIELNVIGKTVITKVLNDKDIKFKQLNFVGIKDIREIEDRKFVDIIGIVTEVSEPQEVITKTQDMRKRIIVIVRDETHSVQITFWENEISKVNFKKGDLVVFYNMLV